MHRPHGQKSTKIVRFRFRVEKPHTAHSQIATAALTLVQISTTVSYAEFLSDFGLNTNTPTLEYSQMHHY